MPWDQLIDQERAVSALRGALARERVAHAYLFYGPDGVGKRATAMAFAQALLCETPGPDPCGRCAHCRKAPRMLHPDLRLLMPHPTDPDTADLAARLKRFGEDHYAFIDYVRRPSLADAGKKSNKQAFYPIKTINEELRAFAGYRPAEARVKVCIVTDAEYLGETSGNALLKLLEEPSPTTVFILTSAHPERLLPTILSRCQKLSFEQLSAEAIEEALVARRGAARTHAALAARMADGSYGRAIDLAENEALMAARPLVVDFLRHAFSSAANPDPLLKLIEQLAAMSREQIKGALGLLLIWVRDLVWYRETGSEMGIVNIDQAGSIKSLCANLPEAQFERMADAVEEAIVLTGGNVNTTLLFSALALHLRAALRGEAGRPLYTPLAEP